MHAGDCAPVYIPPLLPPRGLTFPSLQKFTFFSGFITAVNQCQAGQQLQELFCCLSSGVRTAAREREGCCSSVRARAPMQKLRAFCCAHERRSAGRAFLPRPRPAATGMGGWPPDEEPAGLLLLPACHHLIQIPLSCCHCRLREIKAPEGEYIGLGIRFPLGSWRCDICMHADCRRVWCMAGLASYSCYCCYRTCACMDIGARPYIYDHHI